MPRKRMTTSEFIRKARGVHGRDTFDYSRTIYTHSHDELTIKCKVHGKFTQLPYVHLRGSGCPYCQSESQMELAVRDWLASEGYQFETEARFPECRNKIPLPFDFKVMLGDEFVLIEIDGRHHRESVSVFGGGSKQSEVWRNDRIKEKFCDKNNYPLLRLDTSLGEDVIVERIKAFLGRDE